MANCAICYWLFVGAVNELIILESTLVGARRLGAEIVWSTFLSGIGIWAPEGRAEGAVRLFKICSLVSGCSPFSSVFFIRCAAYHTSNTKMAIVIIIIASIMFLDALLGGILLTNYNTGFSERYPHMKI